MTPVEVVLVDGVEVSVGRDAGCTVVIDDERVSRRHLLVQPSGPGRWRVTDPGSRNGTFRDGQRISEVEVRDGVRLMLGDPTDGVLLDLTASSEATRVAATGRPRTVRVGRHPDNDLVLDHPTVSEHHAVVAFSPTGIEVGDLGSRNGVFANGEPVRRATVVVGTILTLGALDLLVTADGLLPQRGASAVSAGPAGAGGGPAGAGGGPVGGLVPAGGVAIENLTVHRGGRDLLHDVSARIAPGTLTAIVGPSGAGKSTFMGALTGALVPTSGRILIDGHDVLRAGAALRHRVGVVPQDDVLHTALTVRTSLRYSARLRMPAEATAAQREAEVDRVLAALRLTEHSGTRISRLSGGQRRRMNAASELLTQPSVLVLDEPTSGLDPYLERVIMEDLAALAAQGCTIIVITHSAATLDLADVVLAISGGRLVYSGPPSGLPEHFGARGLGTVFAEIGGPGAARWADLWDDESAGTGPAHGSASGHGLSRAELVPLPRQVRGRSHVATLVSRQVRLLLAERGSLVLLLAQAPALGLLTRLYPDGGGYAAGTAPNRDIRTVLLVLVLSATWLGTFAAVRQIVDERRIVERERAAGVSPLQYAVSKMLVLAGLVVVQVVCLMAAGLLGRDLPVGRVVPGPGVELLLSLVLTGWTAVAVGLLASALARSGAAASAVAPLVVIPQMLLCGGLTRVDDRWPLDVATRLVSARAGLSTVASSTGLVDLEPASPSAPPPAPLSAPPSAWAADAMTWWADVAELAGLGLVAWVLLWVVLRSRRSASR